MNNTSPTKNSIPAVNKAIDLLVLLAGGSAETSTKALAYQLGIPRSTCYRILQSLAARDWVHQVEGGGHELSIGLLPLMRPLRLVDRLVSVIQPHLNRLSSRAELAAKLSIRQGDHSVTIARCESPLRTSVSVKLGSTFHLAFGSSGSVLLSGVEETECAAILSRAPAPCWEQQTREDVNARIQAFRQNGWCADLGGFLPNTHAISTLVGDPAKSMAAALTVIGFPHELNETTLARKAKLLLEAARLADASLKGFQTFDAS